MKHLFILVVRTALALQAGLFVVQCKAAAPNATAVKGIKASAAYPVHPVLIRNEDGPLTRVVVDVERGAETRTKALMFRLEGTDELGDLECLRLFTTGAKEAFSSAAEVAGPAKPAAVVTFRADRPLTAGKNVFWLSCRLNETADLSHRVAARCSSIETAAGAIVPQDSSPWRRHRIGVAVRKHNDDGVHTYRIPALATSAKGTLLAVYDMRRRMGRDLQEDIDIGLSRSVDRGQTWQTPRVIMDMGEYGGLPQAQNGCSDPGIIVDRQTGEIFCFAVWMNGKPGKHQWQDDGSEPGFEIGKSAQFMMVRSRDDGVTWSKPENLTRVLKQEAWWLLAPSPQQGIQLPDGTLVMPVQGREGREPGATFATIMISKDHGATWTVGAPGYRGGNECQAALLGDGAIMLNIRNGRERFRAVVVTRDLGRTWQEHATSGNTLIEPKCNGSLRRVDFEQAGEKKHVLLFANPHSQTARTHHTLQVSFDDGASWPESHHWLLDEGRGAGYPSLTQIDAEHVGILYEGSQSHLVFERFKIRELLLPAGVRQETLAEPASAARDFSGWRGGIGITFGTPSRDIADVTEMGYEIVWGSEDPRAVKILGVSVFRYWNSIVETSLKGAGYDFSQMPDKDAAAKLAFDAWMERVYGVKGLSKYASVRYHPKGAYGDVYGSMDLSSENDLVKAVIDKYMRGFEKDGIVHGGIGLDNAGKVPREFLEALARRLNARGLGIAANGCPDQYLTFIDFFGNEGFPFSINYARRAREKGLRGILGEFTMQHLSGGEIDAYLKNKLFNGIVFFGYTNGGTAAGARYSGYCSRPDVYNHQRWVLRKLVPISRAMQRAGRQIDPAARLASAAASRGADSLSPAGVAVNAEGKVEELKRREAGLDRISGRSAETTSRVVRYGSSLGSGIYLFIDSGQPEEVTCDASMLGLHADTLVFDEFSGRVLEAKRDGNALVFKTTAGPSVVQLGGATTLAKSMLARIAEVLRVQLTQRSLDRELGTRFPKKAWARFCQAGKWDTAVAHTGKGSLAVVGGMFTATMPQWKYFNRQGAAQFVSLNQTAPQPIVLRAFSKAREVVASEEVSLAAVGARRRHFDAREGRTYCMHLYLDYQDGQWPEVYTAPFSPGSHDWEEKTIRVNPSRAVKTAMVLLEFHQPEGAAWFDDVSLTSGSESGRNLLAAPGFEEGDSAATQSQAIGKEYEKRVQTLLESIEAALQSANPTGALSAIEKQVDALAASVGDKGLAAYFPRELRDLDHARELLRLCARLLAASH